MKTQKVKIGNELFRELNDSISSSNPQRPILLYTDTGESMKIIKCSDFWPFDCLYVHGTRFELECVFGDKAYYSLPGFERVKAYTTLNDKEGVLVDVTDLPRYTHLSGVIEIPRKYRITNWLFMDEPWRVIHPHIPPETVTSIVPASRDSVRIRASGEKRDIDVILRKKSKNEKTYVMYESVPFAEGIYDVMIVEDLDINIMNVLSVKDLCTQGRDIILGRKIFFADDVRMKPRKISSSWKCEEVMMTFQNVVMTLYDFEVLRIVLIPDGSEVVPAVYTFRNGLPYYVMPLLMRMKHARVHDVKTFLEGVVIDV